MRIMLYDKRKNNECIRIRYNLLTEYIGISSWYANPEKEKEYEHTKRGIARRKKHRQSIKGKITHQKGGKKYLQSRKGRIADKKHQAKRKRNLGFTVLLENKFNCDVDYHHINNEYVIAVPRYMHRGTLGKNHRVECNSLVEKLYDIDIKNEVEKYERNKI